MTLAEKISASFTDNDQIQIHPTVVPKNGHLISESMHDRGPILVSKEGKRFTNELLTRDVASKQTDGQTYLSDDQSIFDSNKLSRGYFEHGYSVKGADLKDLATKINVPADALETTSIKAPECGMQKAASHTACAIRGPSHRTSH